MTIRINMHNIFDMAQYVYPAVFTPEENGMFSVDFPDLEGCFTCGDSLADAIFMAEDALALVLYGYEKDKKEIPEPSQEKNISVNEGEFVNLISADTLKYQKRFNKKSVRKMLTIPMWLNERAEEANVNFSETLKNALVEKLQLAQVPNMAV